MQKLTGRESIKKELRAYHVKYSIEHGVPESIKKELREDLLHGAYKHFWKESIKKELRDLGPVL